MSELDELEKIYMTKEGLTAQQDKGMTGDFRDNMETLKNDPVARAEDTKVRMANIKRLINQLDSADNNVVKRAKREAIRWEINALRVSEKM